MARTFVNGRVHVRRTQCKTCIYRPGNLMHLDEGRREQMEADANKSGGCIPCHDNLYEGAKIEPVCRGYWNVNQSVPLRLAEALERITFTNGDDDAGAHDAGGQGQQGHDSL